MDYLDIIKRLEEENARPDTTDAQREANKWRIQWLKGLNGDKTKTPSTPTKSMDVILESLKDPSFNCAPNFLLDD